jgi:hypothetical protein
VQEDVPVNSVKPTAARAPVLVPRARPGPVTVAAVILGAEVALALVSGSALLVAATTVPAEFINRAAAAAGDGTGAVAPVETANIDAMSTAIRAVLLGAAVVTLLLSVVAAALVVPVARGSWTARVAAFGLAMAAGCAALASTSYTAFGQHVDWAGAVGRDGAAAAATAGRAYGDAMPGWLVGAVGGLTDLQVLGYIAVSVLLALPVVRPYFRRRAGPQFMDVPDRSDVA